MSNNPRSGQRMPRQHDNLGPDPKPTTRYPRYTMRAVLSDVENGRHPTQRTPNAVRGVLRALEAGWLILNLDTNRYALTPEGAAHLSYLETHR